MANPSKLLKNIVNLISKDINEIKKAPGQLDPDSCIALVRYSGALLDVIQYQDKSKKDQKNRLSKMSTEEIKELARQTLVKSK